MSAFPGDTAPSDPAGPSARLCLMLTAPKVMALQIVTPAERQVNAYLGSEAAREVGLQAGWAATQIAHFVADETAHHLAERYGIDKKTVYDLDPDGVQHGIRAGMYVAIKDLDFERAKGHRASPESLAELIYGRPIRRDDRPAF